MEKAAVLAGGGTNHRFGLYDMVMVKDNHLAGGLTVEGLTKGIRQVKEDFPGIRVEVEADTLDQVREFYQVPGVDIIMLDNMPADVMRVAVNERPEGILLEASGGIDLRSVRSVAETGVDFISVGALTHSAGSVDLSLELEIS
jgi:nicotinate-nucleotide pyrophosphorylase (carboxylating)